MTINALAPLSFNDTPLKDTFTQATGTIKTDDAAGSSLLFGITNGVKDTTKTGYDIVLKQTTGNLYLNSSSGQYLFDPVGVDALKSDKSETFTITVTNNSVVSSSNLVVNAKGVDDLPVLSGYGNAEYSAKTSVDGNVFNIDMTQIYTGWTAVGFSSDPLMPDSDTYIAGYDTAKGKSYSFDGLVATAKVQPPIDVKQDWTLKSATETAVGTEVVASRPLNTGDTVGDYDLSTAPYHLLWAYQTTDDTGAVGHTGRGASVTPISFKNGDSYSLIGGKLTISDGDKDTITAAVKTDGLYGKATVDAKGAWTYLLDNSKLPASSVQSLAAKEMLNDSLTLAFTAGGVTVEKTVTFPVAYGVNDAPSGSVDISGDTKVGSSLKANNKISDSDLDASEKASSTTYTWQMSTDGQRWIDIDGSSSYSPDFKVEPFLQGQKLRVIADYFDGGAHEKVISTVSNSVSTSQSLSSIETDQPVYILADSIVSAKYIGFNNANLTGNGQNNKLITGKGDDILDGGAGVDELNGGLGNDTYRVDNLKDKIIEDLESGIDKVESSVNWILGKNLENLTLTDKAISATGNTLDNVLIGNSEANTLSGKGGHDILTGGAGKDSFVFDQKIVVENASVITDFVVGEDKLLLSKKIFKVLDTSHVIYDTASGALAYDIDGAGTKSSPVTIVTLIGAPHITNADIQLV